MTLARTHSVALVGVKGHLIEVEADITQGLPLTILVGLPDTALREARDRIRAAIVNSGEKWPQSKITVGLSPASLPKRGSGFDIAIAIAILAADGAVPLSSPAGTMFLAELGLDGRLRPVPGVLPAVVAAAAEGMDTVLVAAQNAAEAGLVPDVRVIAAGSLAEVATWLRGGPAPLPPSPPADRPGGAVKPPARQRDLAEVLGQSEARKAAEICAAGGHNLSLLGPPGAGKTMLAERLPTILPRLEPAAALEVTSIHSVAGALPPDGGLVTEPPFCAPHHTASKAAIVGGGSGVIRPGAASLAHRGVLFLDEASELPCIHDDISVSGAKSRWKVFVQVRGRVRESLCSSVRPVRTSGVSLTARLAWMPVTGSKLNCLRLPCLRVAVCSPWWRNAKVGGVVLCARACTYGGREAQSRARNIHGTVVLMRQTTSMRRLHIDAKDDLILRLAHRDRPVDAVIELIWNSLDAEANSVAVVIERNAFDGVECVRVEDDGHGMAPEVIPSAFQDLGGSWKATAKLSPNIKRPMNGRNGQGRVRGFALGNVISWTTVARDTTGALKRTIVSGRASDPTNFDPDETPVIGDERLGTIFIAEDPAQYVNRITGDTARPRITATFALFLTSNPGVAITFDGAPLDPVSAEKHRADYELDKFAKEGKPGPTLRIIEWVNDPGRAIHLCDVSGAVLSTVAPEIHTPGFNYTAYLLWDDFASRNEELLLAELQSGELADVVDAARQQIRTHFHAREVERRAEQVQKWKDQGDYPYAGEAETEAERAERETFDFVATTVARKIPKAQMARRTTLGLLKVAVANEPSSLPEILDQLMPLPKSEQQDLARLLKRTTMSKLIEANTAVTNRLDFLAALRQMVFDLPIW